MNPLYSRFGRSTRERGSVLVICMVLAALGTIGVAAWMSLLSARGHQIEASFVGFERRVARENSRSLAHRALYANALPANAPFANNLIIELPDGKGRAVIQSFTTVPLKSNAVGAPSRNGATPLTSHSTQVAVDIGADSTRWTYRLRNYHPALAGDLLTLHAPVAPTDTAPLVSGNIRVKGRAVFWDAVVRDLNNGLRADEYLLPNGIAGSATFSTTAGTVTLPLNYPHYLRTTGQTRGGPAYRGELELLDAKINPANAYEARIPGVTSSNLNGNSALSKSKGPASRVRKTNDDALLTFIEQNPPDIVTAELVKHDSLSSVVLWAAVHKPLSNEQIYKVFNAQVSLPDDALTDMMANLNETTLTDPLDMAIIEMNEKHDAVYNVDGKGMVQVFLARPEMSYVVIQNAKRLRLIGQNQPKKAAEAALLPPLLLILDNRNGDALSRIDLLHGNSRPLIVAIASSPSSPAQPDIRFKGNSAFPVWKAVFDLQNTGLAFDLSSVAGVRILGGIRGNHRLSVAGGTLTLERDPDGAILAPLLSRDAWIECVRN